MPTIWSGSAIANEPPRMNSLERPLAILKWIARAANRNRRSFISLAGNNLFYAAITLAFMLDPVGAQGAFILVGIIVVLPMSSDPLRAIPRVRMLIWPLENGERRLLRLISPWLNPMTWIVLALALVEARVVGNRRARRRRGRHGLHHIRARRAWRQIALAHVPRYPGPLNHLIRKNLREMLSTLDFWCGALIAVAALGWRAAGLLPHEAFFPLTAIAMVGISTCALTLFGLDGAAGMTRYRLMPLRGWQILLAKDIAYLTMAIIVAVPLSIPAAMGAALIALAIGHKTSVRIAASPIALAIPDRPVVRRRADADDPDDNGRRSRGLFQPAVPAALCRRVDFSAQPGGSAVKSTAPGAEASFGAQSLENSSAAKSSMRSTSRSGGHSCSVSG